MCCLLLGGKLNPAQTRTRVEKREFGHESFLNSQLSVKREQELPKSYMRVDKREFA